MKNYFYEFRIYRLFERVKKLIHRDKSVASLTIDAKLTQKKGAQAKSLQAFKRKSSKINFS
ncbi:hypothetical protein M1K46_02290 [Fictibacillus sp. WQ 8-8]|nr:hypothetical protein [Fictibacillus sp. WQ 8-8]